MLGLETFDQADFVSYTPPFPPAAAAAAADVDAGESAGSSDTDDGSGTVLIFNEDLGEYEVLDSSSAESAGDTGEEAAESAANPFSYIDNLAEACDACIGDGDEALLAPGDYDYDVLKWNQTKFGPGCWSNRYFGLRGVVVDFQGDHTVYK